MLLQSLSRIDDCNSKCGADNIVENLQATLIHPAQWTFVHSCLDHIEEAVNWSSHVTWLTVLTVAVMEAPSHLNDATSFKGIPSRAVVSQFDGFTWVDSTYVFAALTCNPILYLYPFS